VMRNSFDLTRAATDKGKSPMNQPPPASTTKGPGSSGAPAKTTGIVPPDTKESLCSTKFRQMVQMRATRASVQSVSKA
jgi:hypothetical protein